MTLLAYTSVAVGINAFEGILINIDSVCNSGDIPQASSSVQPLKEEAQTHTFSLESNSLSHPKPPRRDGSTFTKPQFTKPRVISHHTQATAVPGGFDKQATAYPRAPHSHTWHASTLAQGGAQNTPTDPSDKQARTGLYASSKQHTAAMCSSSRSLCLACRQ